MITREEYAEHARAQDDWAPGWDAVEGAFAALYPGVEPQHLASDLTARAMFGGQEWLDGASLYPSPHGYQHIVTFGMSSLYADPDHYGGEYSGWGYEMTAKIAASSPEDAFWMVDSMSRLARYTYGSKSFLQPYETVAGRAGEPIRQGSDSALTSLLVVPDTEVAGVDSVHGRLDFLQLVGITDAELAWVTSEPTAALDRGRELAARLVASGNPMLVTDLARISVV